MEVTLDGLIVDLSNIGVEILKSINGLRITNPKEDFREIQTTAQMIQVITFKIKKSQHNLEEVILKPILETTSNIIKKINEILMSISDEGEKISRNKRKELVTYNSKLYNGLNIILSYISGAVTEGKGNSKKNSISIKKKHATIRKEITSIGEFCNGGTKMSEEKINEEEGLLINELEEADTCSEYELLETREATVNKYLFRTLTSAIRDKEGALFWKENFNSMLCISYEEWEIIMEEKFRQNNSGKTIFSNEFYRNQLKRIVVHSDESNIVTNFKFGFLLDGFGPFNKLWDNLLSLFKSDWFFYYLSPKETECLLYFQQKGTYLIRFSSSNPGAFVLSFTNKEAPNTVEEAENIIQEDERRIFHILIELQEKKGYGIQEPNGIRCFPNIESIIHYYTQKGILSVPLETLFPISSDFYFGEFDQEATEDFFISVENGSFLFRFESDPHPSFVLSYRYNDLAYHSHLFSTNQQLCFESDTSTVYDSFDSLLEDYQILRIPLSLDDIPDDSQYLISENDIISQFPNTNNNNNNNNNMSQSPKNNNNTFIRGRKPRIRGGRGGRGSQRGQRGNFNKRGGRGQRGFRGGPRARGRIVNH